MNFRSPFWGSEVSKLASLSPGKLRKHELLKNPPNTSSTKRKVVGKGRFSLSGFLPGV
jgi:hypothetical protein